jgi:hypothetical protein
MRFGGACRMQALTAQGHAIFGVIEQQVVKHSARVISK